VYKKERQANESLRFRKWVSNDTNLLTQIGELGLEIRNRGDHKPIKDLPKYIYSWLEGESSLLQRITEMLASIRPEVYEYVPYDRSDEKARVTDHGKRRSFLRVVHNVLHVYKMLKTIFAMDKLTADELSSWLVRWQHMENEGILSATIKWWSASLFSICCSQERPAPPKQSMKIFGVVPGRPGRFIRSVVKILSYRLFRRPTDRKALFKAQTLQNIKKGTATVSPRFISETLVKHRKTICTGPTGFENAPTQLDSIMCASAAIVDDVFTTNGRPTKFFFKEKASFPSIRGHYHAPGVSSEWTGGAASKILQVWETARDSAGPEKLDTAQSFALSSHGSFTLPSHSEEIQKIFALLVEKEVEKELRAGFTCRPIAIPESCKTRVVTAGPIFSYWVLREVQQFLWDTLKIYPVYSLIGKPASSDTVNIGNCGPDEIYISGDYKAATDNLRSDLSHFVMDRVARRCSFPNWLRRLCLRALVGHSLDYEGEILPQRNGQLMGSPISFPVLCLVNHAVCDSAMVQADWTLDEIPPRDRPLRINGDDCLFKGPLSLPDIWLRLCKAAGLESSIGKTYFSPFWFQINSQIFTWNYEENIPKPVGYVNFGHVSPVDPKGGAERDWTDLPSLLEDLLRGHSKSKKERLTSLFLHDFRFLLSHVPDGMSYWMPRDLGGLGLPRDGCILDMDEEISFRQMELANYLLKNPEKEITWPKDQAYKALWMGRAKKVLSKWTTLQKCSNRDEGLSPWAPPTGQPTGLMWDLTESVDIIEDRRKRCNFQKYFRLSKGTGAGPLGLYLGAFLYKRVLPYGICELLDDLHPSPSYINARMFESEPGRSDYSLLRKDRHAGLYPTKYGLRVNFIQWDPLSLCLDKARELNKEIDVLTDALAQPVEKAC